MTNAQVVREVRQLGCTCRYESSTKEFIINLPREKGGTLATAYFTDDAEDAIGTAKAMLKRVEGDQHSPWQTMESAPRDGTEVLIVVEYRAGVPGRMLVGHYMPGGFCIEDHPAIDTGWYFWNGHMFDKASKPMFWMPLPESPKVSQ